MKNSEQNPQSCQPTINGLVRIVGGRITHQSRLELLMFNKTTKMNKSTETPILPIRFYTQPFF